MKTKAALVAVAVLGVSLAAGFADAGMIGVNFIGGRTGGETNGIVTGTAGQLPQANWNNMSGDSGGPTALIDDSGATLATTTVTWSCSNTYTVTTGTPGDQDSALMKGYLDTNDSASNTTVTVANIPYAQYAVYIYYDGDSNNGTRGGEYTVNGVATTVDANGVLWDDANWPVTAGGGTYTLAAADGHGGNYYVFTGFNNTTNPNVEVVADEGAGSFRAPLNAIQIHEIPEPSTLLLAGIALLGVALLRRR
jgi:hypothetical protein